MDDGPVAALCRCLRELGIAGEIKLEATRQGAPRGAMALIPNAKKPRIIIPAAHPRASAAALHRFSADLDNRQRLQRILAVQALRTLGARPPIAHHQLSLTGGGGQGLSAHLNELMGQEVVFSLSIGNARANQKPILQLFTMSGDSLGFVKVGTNSFTANLVRQEAENLRTLADKRFEVLAAPRLIHSGTWQDFELLVMEPLPTSVWSRSRKFERLRRQAEQELAERFGEQRIRIELSDWFQQLPQASKYLDADQELWGRWSEAVDMMASRFGPQELVFTVSHGDWTAWNMAVYRGKLQVWDWERFARSLPAGFDRLHFEVHRQLGLSGVNTHSVEVAFGREPQISDAVKACYLIDLIGRYLLGQGEQQVESVRGKTEVLIRTLEELLGK